MSKRSGFSLTTNWPAIWLIPILLCAAIGSLRAQVTFEPHVIDVTEVKVYPKSVSMKIAGILPRYPDVRSIELHRARETTDSEWNKQIEHLQKHEGKTVSIVIIDGASGIRGGQLSLFRKSEIRLQEQR